MCFAHEAGEEPRILVVVAARRGAHDHANLLALVEVSDWLGGVRGAEVRSSMLENAVPRIFDIAVLSFALVSFGARQTSAVVPAKGRRRVCMVAH